MNKGLVAFVLRVPFSLHRRLKLEARQAGLSVNRYCLGILRGETTDSVKQGHTLTPPRPLGHGLRADFLQDLSERVLETVGGEVDGLVLFGSLARGRETASSDVDLLVVLNKNVALDRDAYSRWQFDRFAGREISPLFVHLPVDGEKIGGIWLEVALDGVVLFDRDLGVTRFLSRVRNLVADGKVRRRTTHGHPYWVYAEDANPESATEREL